MSDNNPGFYSITPATVRYNKNLIPMARLLYGEITALCSIEGFCWASNNYFSELYGVHKNTISKWISSLEKEGHIEIIVKNTLSGYERRIYPINKNVEGPKRKDLGALNENAYPPKRKAEHINTMSNTTINKIKYGDVVKMTLEQYTSLINKFTKSYTNELLERMDNYCVGNGKRYKDYYRVALNWVKRDKDCPVVKPVKKSTCSDCGGELPEHGYCDNCGIYD